MKTTNYQSNSNVSRIVFATIPAILVAASMPLAAQVVIEGGPGTVQVSDQDGQPEAANAAAPISSPVLLEAVPRGPLKPRDGTVSVQPNELEDTTVAVPKMVKSRDEVSTEISSAPGTAVVAPATTGISPELAKRTAELKRELAIQDNGTRAAVAVTTEGLFSEGTNTVDELSEVRLMQIAEYLKLTNEEQVDVTYHYVAGEESEETAWARSLAIVEWMKSSGQINQEVFRLNDPTPAERTPDRSNPQNVTDTEVVGWIELVMQ